MFYFETQRLNSIFWFFNIHILHGYVDEKGLSHRPINEHWSSSIMAFQYLTGFWLSSRHSRMAGLHLPSISTPPGMAFSYSILTLVKWTRLVFFRKPSTCNRAIRHSSNCYFQFNLCLLKAIGLIVFSVRLWNQMLSPRLTNESHLSIHNC